MIQSLKKHISSEHKLLVAVYWLIGFFWTFILVKVAVQFLTGVLSSPSFEATKDLIFVAMFSVSLIYLHKQLSKTYKTYTSREKVYAKLFQKNPYPMWVYDLKTLRFLTVNDAALSLYGYSEEEFLNLTIKDIRPNEDVPAIIESTKSVKENFCLNYHWSGTWRHKNKTGKMMYVEISSHEIIFEGKKAELVMAYDVTGKVNQDLKLQAFNRDLERMVMKRTDDLLQLNQKLVDQNKVIKSTNHELYSMTKQLEEANEKIKESTDLKNRFISMASHEFGTPLENIKHEIFHIKQHLNAKSNQPLMVKAEKIEKQVGLLTYLLDDVLTIGKTDSVKIQVSEEPVNLRDFSCQIKEEVEHTMKDSPHKIILTVDENVPEIINSDQKLLRNIFINLLTNAIKYSPGRDSIHFEISKTDRDINFKVRDEGLGMDEDEKEKIFQPFYRMESAKDLQGTGLGLSIVKKAVDLIHAKIDIESEVNKGSVFTVMVPSPKMRR